MTGIMTSRAMPGAGDPTSPSGARFKYSVPHFQLYDNPYELADRFQLQELARRIGRPIKITIDRRGRSNDPGKDKLVQHFVSLEGMGHLKRETAVAHLTAIFEEQEKQRLEINSQPEPEAVLPDPTEPNAEIIRLAGLSDSQLRKEAKASGVEVAKGEKRASLMPKLLQAKGIGA